MVLLVVVEGVVVDLVVVDCVVDFSVVVVDVGSVSVPVISETSSVVVLVGTCVVDSPQAFS